MSTITIQIRYDSDTDVLLERRSKPVGKVFVPVLCKCQSLKHWVTDDVELVWLSLTNGMYFANGKWQPIPDYVAKKAYEAYRNETCTTPE